MSNFLRSLPRHIKSAILSLFRNFAMSISAIMAVSITISILSIFLLIISNITYFTNNVVDDFRIHVVLQNDIKADSEIAAIKNELSKIDHVKGIIYSDADNELALMIKERGDAYQMYENDNPLSNAFYIEIDDPDLMHEITNQLKMKDYVFDAQYGGDSVNGMIELLGYIRYGGIALLAILSALVLFLIHNVTKITIYARSNEIGIMRNVGASGWYIKTPFLLEGVLISLIGSILPCLLTYLGYKWVLQISGGYLFTRVFTLISFKPYIYIVMLILCIFAIVVGLIASFLSVNKYLKFKR